MSDSQHVRQWRIVAIAVVGSTGRPLFLKNFPPAFHSGAAAGGEGDVSAAAAAAASGVSRASVSTSSSSAGTPSPEAIRAFTGDAKQYISPWAKKMVGDYHSGGILPKQHARKADSESGGVHGDDEDEEEDDDDDEFNMETYDPGDNDSLCSSVRQQNNNNSNNNQQQQQQQNSSSEGATPPTAATAKEEEEQQQQQQQRNSDEKESALDLQGALSAALDCEDYSETETAQLFLYAALDRIDARRATEERRSGNPFESRGYAVFDRETRTRMKAFVLVRYWGRSLPQDCHLPCQTILNQLIQKATYAYCDPFRDVTLDEPLSESLVMDSFLSGIVQSNAEIPRPVHKK